MTIPGLDLTPEALAIVRAILQEFVPQLAVWAFGSRTTGQAERFSDLDLAYLHDGPLPFNTIADLSEAFDESDLPFAVDLVDMTQVSPEFRSIIEAHRILLQSAPPFTDTTGARRRA